MPEPPTAADLGLMEGYPAPPERRVTRDNMLTPPFNRWAFQHMRELLPTAPIARGSGPVRPLPADPASLDDLTFTAHGGERRTLREMLDECYADALVVLHDGRLVHETYRNGMTPATPHQMMSVTKSMVGLLAMQLVCEGRIDPDALVPSYVPELAGSAWGDATVRHALDMTTGIRFDEAYGDVDSEIGQYAIACNLYPCPQGYDGPDHIAALLPTFQREGRHGERFHYVTPNTDVIGWIIARVTGRPFSRLFSERIWSRIGAEHDAYILKDPAGFEVTGGGLNATARDLARVGQLLLDDGVVDGARLLDPAVIADARAGGDRDAFARSDEAVAGSPYEGWSYRSFWWVSHNAHGAFTGIGINGQWLWVDPTARVVIVLQSSHPDPVGEEADASVIPGLHAIAAQLHAMG